MPTASIESVDDERAVAIAPRDRDVSLAPFATCVAAPPILVADSGAQVRFASPAAATLLGIELATLTTSSVEALAPGTGLADLVRRVARVTDPTASVSTTFAILGEDSAATFVDATLGPFLSAGGAMTLIALRDVTRRVHAERDVVRLAADLRERLEELGDALRAKDLLLREVHHRVKNNLQIVSSLLSLQARRATDAEARAQFEESRDRLVSMSLVHEQLYRGSDLGRVDFGAYLRSLVVEIGRGHVDRAAGVNIEVRADGLSLAIDAAVPAGLIVHELVSNALKHAFPDGRTGSVLVEFAAAEEGFREVRVSDDGAGFAEDSAAAATFGKKLVALLVRQLNAEMTTTSGNGTSVRIRFREHEAEEPLS